MRGQLDAVVGDELVDVAVLVALGLRMADQNDHLGVSSQPRRLAMGELHYEVLTRGFPMLLAVLVWSGPWVGEP